MKEPDLQRIEALFQAAADLPAEERAAYLDRECPRDPCDEGGTRIRARVDAEADLAEGPGTIIGRYKLPRACISFLPRRARAGREVA